MSGSETGNVALFDVDDNDPTKYRPLMVDRADRIRYPKHVGNAFINRTEQIYAAAGGTVPSAQFLTGRLRFNAGASGTITLPTAASMITFLNNYYNQAIGLQGPFTNSSGVSNDIVNEITVEFYNTTAAAITLAVNTGITFVGNAGGLVVPATSIAAYRFVIVTTNPAAISMFPGAGAGGGSTATLLPQAPTQLVDYNPATGQLGYVTNAVLAGQANTDVLLGWNATTSTPSRVALAQGTAQQVLTRNATTGALVWSDQTNYPVGTATTVPIGYNATTGVLEQITPVNFSALAFRSQVGAETVPNGGVTTIVTYDTATTGAPNVSYAAGVFTVTTPGSYIACVDYAFAAALANTGSYISMRAGNSIAGNEVYRSGQLVSSGSFSVPFSADSTFAQFVVTITNNEAGVITLLTGAGGLGIRNAVKVMRVQ